MFFLSPNKEIRLSSKAFLSRSIMPILYGSSSQYLRCIDIEYAFTLCQFMRKYRPLKNIVYKRAPQKEGRLKEKTISLRLDDKNVKRLKLRSPKRMFYFIVSFYTRKDLSFFLVTVLKAN